MFRVSAPLPLFPFLLVVPLVSYCTSSRRVRSFSVRSIRYLVRSGEILFACLPALPASLLSSRCERKSDRCSYKTSIPLPSFSLLVSSSHSSYFSISPNFVTFKSSTACTRQNITTFSSRLRSWRDHQLHRSSRVSSSTQSLPRTRSQLPTYRGNYLGTSPILHHLTLQR